MNHILYLSGNINVKYKKKAANRQPLFVILYKTIENQQLLHLR